jgi:transposase InsO family protein
MTLGTGLMYVMLDVFSRYVVGWMVAHRESAMYSRLSARLPASRSSPRCPCG